jgi:hypothetical protein
MLRCAIFCPVLSLGLQEKHEWLPVYNLVATKKISSHSFFACGKLPFKAYSFLRFVYNKIKHPI